MSDTARRAERIALALVNGEHPITPDALDDLRLANRERTVELDVAAVYAFQNGEAVWSVPQRAPWAGFGAR